MKDISLVSPEIFVPISKDFHSETQEEIFCPNLTIRGTVHTPFQLGKKRLYRPYIVIHKRG